MTATLLMLLAFIPLIAAFYLVTAVMTAIVSNAATAVMLTPVAILAATQAGVNPYALLVAVMFGASASFVTPFGYQTNVMIYGPGGYRSSDFVKVAVCSTWSFSLRPASSSHCSGPAEQAPAQRSRLPRPRPSARRWR